MKYYSSLVKDLAKADAETDRIDVIRAAWAERRPDIDTAPIGVVGRILLAARLLQDAAEPLMTQAQLTRAEFDLLTQLRRSDRALRPGDLTAGLVGSPAATTKRLQRLTDAGLVARSPDPTDGRASRVSLTAAGARLVDDLFPRQLDDERALLTVLSADDQAQLAAILRRALRAWER